jgi:hypothetical protein
MRLVYQNKRQPIEEFQQMWMSSKQQQSLKYKFAVWTIIISDLKCLGPLSIIKKNLTILLAAKMD